MTTNQDRADKLAAAASLATEMGVSRGRAFAETLTALRAYMRSFEEAVKAALNVTDGVAAAPHDSGNFDTVLRVDDVPCTEAPSDDRQRLVRPWQELKTTGLLWLINAAVLHPRGYALALVYSGGDHNEPMGWRLLGDGSEPWIFNDPTDEPFTHVESFLAAHRD